MNIVFADSEDLCHTFRDCKYCTKMYVHCTCIKVNKFLQNEPHPLLPHCEMFKARVQNKFLACKTLLPVVISSDHLWA